MISYAQNAEDVVLARLFDGVDAGRYVDVGASDPVDSSVTKHFYDLGWRGINVEPVPAVAEKLAGARPEDVTLQVALGSKPGKVVLHVVQNESGWSTLNDDLARGYQREQHWEVRDVEVEMTTLAQVLDEHPGPVDFLKIDVEGAERAVLEGADFARHRPRVIVVEATRPGSPTPAHQEWEPILLEAGYRCALFDGLNRFYAVADDEPALIALAAPANVLDHYEHYTRRLESDSRAAVASYSRRLEDTLREAQAARAHDAEYLKKLEETIDSARLGSAEAQRYVAALETRVAELEASNANAANYVAMMESHTAAPVRQVFEKEDPAEFVRRINAAGGAYHRLDFGDQLVIEGTYDMARYLPLFNLPDRLDGMTVLDVGTATGFFAIECERRGAQVTAIDVQTDRLLPRLIPTFELDIDFKVKDLYELDAAFGEFDLVICGTLLLHLPDPLGALRAIRQVAGDRLIVSTSATPDSAAQPLPVCHFYGEHAADGDYWSYWGISAAALRRMVLAAGFSRVDHVEHFDIAPEDGRSGASAPQVVLSAYR